MKSIQEHNFTSTGIKFWANREQMINYSSYSGRSIISTHISPEGSCNLNCSFCSVKKRKKHFRIDLDTIKKYIRRLQGRNLQAVILTGGGEPTLYPQFNELVQWIASQGLKVALITNGTNSDKVDEETWSLFTWVRVSINTFNGWKKRIFIPDFVNCLVGGSFVYDGKGDSSVFYDVAYLGKKMNLEYIRVIPNCLLDQQALIKKHKEIEDILELVDDSIFFHQFKIHGVPHAEVCHQAYFRPYLSEFNGGTVYPCDSVVLNNNEEHFADKYQICKADQILEFLDGKIKMKFDIQRDCSGCVFTSNINMLEKWENRKIEPDFDIDLNNIIHKEFV